MTQSRETLLSWMDAIEESGHGLTKWECDFVESLRDQIVEGGTLSERQIEILERIYAEKTP